MDAINQAVAESFSATVTDNIPQETALRLQLAMIRGHDRDGFFEIRPKNKDGHVVARAWVPLAEHLVAASSAILERSDAGLDVWIGASPRTNDRGGRLADVERSWCLRVDCDDQEASRSLLRFQPLPSMIVASGGQGRCQGWWQLNTPLPNGSIDRMNRRLAKHLGGDVAVAHAAAVLRPAGTCNWKYPRPVRCVRLEPSVHAWQDVAGELADDDRYQPRSTPVIAIRATQPGRRNVDGLVKRVRDTQSGNRNQVLYWAACCARDDGALDGVVEQMLLDAAVTAGLDEREAVSTIRSARERKAAA